MSGLPVPGDGATTSAERAAADARTSAATTGIVNTEPTTVADWLAQRSPPPPSALLIRLKELLGDQAGRPGDEAPAVCLQAGQTRLAAMLGHGATDRTSALDLLAVDALVSYAFEAAASTPESLEQLAADAMTRIAEIPEAS